MDIINCYDPDFRQPKKKKESTVGRVLRNASPGDVFNTNTRESRYSRGIGGGKR
jgi:hypothetical protein